MTEPAEHDGLWLSVTELAARKGVRKSTISEKVTKLVQAGRLTVKSGKGRSKLINVAQYDTAIGETGDVAREQGAATKAADAAELDLAPSEPSSASKFRDEATREKAYKADLAQIELEKARGNLLIVSEFDAVAEDAASRVAEIIDGLMSRDSELTASAISGGENGVRAVLKRIAREQRQAIVDALKEMAVTARARARSSALSLPSPSDPQPAAPG